MKRLEREERDSNILRMHFQGESILKIAGLFGMSQRSVRRILKRYEVACGENDVSRRGSRSFPNQHEGARVALGRQITVSDKAEGPEGDPLLHALVQAYPGGPPVRDVAVASRLF